MSESYRTQYDKAQFQSHNPLKEGYDYHSAPYPTPRTQYDADLQERTCSSCPFRSIEKYGNDNPSSYRTKYDMEQQKIYAASALGDTDYGKAMYKSGFYSKTPSYTESYKERFADDDAYATGFTRAGFYSSGTPVWSENYRKTRENYGAGPNLYQDPDLPPSFGLFGSNAN